MPVEDGWFKKGHKGLPGCGKPSLPPEIRAERKQNQAALIRLVAAHFNMTDEQARLRVDGPDVSRAEMAVFRMIEKATKDGDVTAFKLMMEIMCGKIPESDWDEISEDTLRMVLRAQEIREEERAKLKSIDVDGSSSKAGSSGTARDGKDT